MTHRQPRRHQKTAEILSRIYREEHVAAAIPTILPNRTWDPGLGDVDENGAAETVAVSTGGRS